MANTSFDHVLHRVCHVLMGMSRASLSWVQQSLVGPSCLWRGHSGCAHSDSGVRDDFLGFQVSSCRNSLVIWHASILTLSMQLGLIYAILCTVQSYQNCTAGGQLSTFWLNISWAAWTQLHARSSKWTRSPRLIDGGPCANWSFMC